MQIRRAIPTDAPALSRLSALAFAAKFGALYPPAVLQDFLAATYNEAATAALIGKPGVAVWLVEAAAGLQAYAVLAPAGLPHPEVSPGCIELRRLYTAPDATGQGLGTRLMREVVIPAADAAAGDCWLGVYAGNPEAQRFYARFGFEAAGEYEFPVGPVRDREFIRRRRRP